MEKEMEILIEAAEQLQALKATLMEQQGSSVRLRSMTDTLEQVATQIAKIPSGLSAVLTKAEAVEQRVVAATSKVEALRDGIPAIVQRIEQSDAGRSVDTITNVIAESRSDLKDFRESISNIDDLVQQIQGTNESILQEIKEDLIRAGEAQTKVNASVYALRLELLTKLEGMEKRIVSTEQCIGAIGKTVEVVAIDVKSVGVRQFTAFQGFQDQLDTIKAQAIAEMRKELKSISALIHQQGIALEALSKKKGFLFWRKRR